MHQIWCIKLQHWYVNPTLFYHKIKKIIKKKRFFHILFFFCIFEDMIWIYGLINVASDIYSVMNTDFYITKSLAKNATKTITIISNQELSTFHITFVPINKSKISWVLSTRIFKLILTSVLQKKFAFCRSKKNIYILFEDSEIAADVKHIT